MRAGLKVIEYSAADHATASSTARQYILASSDCAVEDEALHSLFEQQSAHLQTLTTDPKLERGRGKVQFFEYQGHKLVLRQYRRGGLVSRVLKHSYLWTGLEKTRAFRELSLLVEISQMPVSACLPFAARVIRTGLVYQAQLITEQVSDAQTFGELLQDSQVTSQVLQAIGRAIRLMHDENIHHADLNANNILISNGEAVFIDFDRGRMRRSKLLDWRGASLKRLLRSIHKLQQRHGFEFCDAQWQLVLKSYQA